MSGYDFATIVVYIIRAISGMITYAGQLFELFNVKDFLLGAFAIFTIFRLLLSPLSGSAGSDSVKKTTKKGDSNG